MQGQGQVQLFWQRVTNYVLEGFEPGIGIQALVYRRLPFCNYTYLEHFDVFFQSFDPLKNSLNFETFKDDVQAWLIQVFARHVKFITMEEARNVTNFGSYFILYSKPEGLFPMIVFQTDQETRRFYILSDGFPSGTYKFHFYEHAISVNANGDKKLVSFEQFSNVEVSIERLLLVNLDFPKLPSVLNEIVQEYLFID